MTRVKGFDQDIAVQALTSGELHQPDTSQIYQAEIVDSPENIEAQLDALLIGRPVIDALFNDKLRLSRGFETYPDKTIESSRSAHGVSFGRFIHWIPTRKQNGTALEIALKPFESPEDALREFHGYRRLGGLAVETFEPVAVFPAKNGDHFIGMTKKRNDLQSLDRDEWIVGRRVKDASDAEIAERNSRTVQDIAEGLAYIHAQGIFHPDGQIKNWATTPEGQIGIIDAENLTEVELGSVDSAQLAWGDIEKLVKSLVFDSRDLDAKMFGVGMFAGTPVDQLRTSLEQLIVVPYYETLTKMLEGTNDPAAHAQISNLFEGIMTRFYDDKTWPSHLVDMQHTPYPDSQVS